jgi:hypothetical protein
VLDGELPQQRGVRERGAWNGVFRRLAHEGAVDDGEVLGENGDVVPTGARVGRPVECDVPTGDRGSRDGLQPAFGLEDVRRRPRGGAAGRVPTEGERRSSPKWKAAPGGG